MDKPHAYARAFLEIAKDSHSEELAAHVKNFIAVLRRRNDAYLLPKIVRIIEGSFSRGERTMVTSRFPLDESTKQDLVRFLKQKFDDVEEGFVAYETDESILGGVSVRHKDFLFDATLGGVLEQWKRVA